ncbi:hypothetical protein E2C01_063039 [Portunus trituberculatus]|uniref:Secreted protein n=1 Tax=Portunus trituberculatus TaxID=210409 RepID=A0A5B7HGG0_PORTR|nr:hypothetical protein [Portunus trituberculatus]
MVAVFVLVLMEASLTSVSRPSAHQLAGSSMQVERDGLMDSPTIPQECNYSTASHILSKQGLKHTLHDEDVAYPAPIPTMRPHQRQATIH